MEPYKKFLVPFDSTKLKRFWRNDSLTEKATNAPHLISQSEPPEPKEIMVPKMRTYLSVLSRATGASITPEKRIPRKKVKIKSLTISPPIKDIITNQDKNNLGI